MFIFQRNVRETCEHVGSFLHQLLQGSFSDDKTLMLVLMAVISANTLKNYDTLFISLWILKFVILYIFFSSGLD